MSRSGYVDDFDGDYDYNVMNLYSATVRRSIAGKRGQSFLKDLAKSMDEMKIKKLITDDLVTETGEMCTIGVVCKARGIDTSDTDVNDPESVGQLVNISSAMAAEIEYENDQQGPNGETPEQRWTRMRNWVQENINKEKVDASNHEPKN